MGIRASFAVAVLAVLAALVGSGAAAAGASRPANDSFASAQSAAGSSGSVTGSSVRATKEAGEPAHAGNAGGRSVWYRWTAPATGTATIDTAGSGFDTLLAVYAGSSVGALTQVAANDDVSSTTYQSRVTFGAVGGTTYQIAVDGYGGASGSVKLSWSGATATAPPATPSNDPFASAQPISGTSGTVAGTTSGATKEAGEPAHAGNAGGRSIWFSWSVPSSGTATIDTLGSGFDTLLAVYTGSSVSGLTPVAANDDVSSTAQQSRVSFGAVAGTTYRIAVDGSGGASGAVSLAWSVVVPPASSSNDAFASPLAISGAAGSVASTTAGMTKEPGEPAHAGNAGGRSIWFSWTAPASGTVAIDTAGSSFDTLLAVYNGSSVGALTSVAASDDISPITIQSRVSFAAAAGTTYRIAVDGYGGASGSVLLSWSQPTPSSDPVLVAAGDVAGCDTTGDEATAKLVAAHPAATVATLGDNVHENGQLSLFTNCYQPSWGASKARTKPAVGNHEYETSGAAGYFGYFGTAAGDPARGYYSYDLGAWHVVVLNSNCGFVGGCGAGSPQDSWLRSDLAAHPGRCTLAYWHHPRFTSGDGRRTDDTVLPFWQALASYGADVVLNGHHHAYERFAPQTPSGGLDRAGGIRQFTVGTGGYSYEWFGPARANSDVRIHGSYGVLKLTLHAGSYDWHFLPEAGKTATDSGTSSCS